MKRMVIMVKSLFIVLHSLVALVVSAATPTVSNVTAKQRYPWNGMVDITCTVSGISGTAGRFEFTVAAVDSGNVHDISQFWVVRDGTNSLDHAIRTNGTYHLVWDSKAGFDNQICSNMVMRVNLAVIHDKVQLWANGPYWATTNIGAEEPWEYGYSFWWGDTVGYKRENDAWVASDGSSADFSFEETNTPTYKKDNTTLQSEGWITADGVLASEHDAAQVHWGGDWRMPTDQELVSLTNTNNCDWTWTTMNGVNGYVVRGRGDYASNSIFLPAAGYGTMTSLGWTGSEGHYWSSVTHSHPANSYVWLLHIQLSVSEYGFRSTVHNVSYGNRARGRSVRPLQGYTK